MALDSSLEELEYKNLQGAVADVEALLAYAAPRARVVYEDFLSNTRRRLDFLEKKIEETKTEHVAEVHTQAAAAALAAKETKLSMDERETYREFLEESSFTKKDFGKLDEFYSSYDRLSESDKEEMSSVFMRVSDVENSKLTICLIPMPSGNSCICRS